MFDTLDCALHHTVYTFMHNSDPHTEMARLLSQLALAGFSEGAQWVLKQTATGLGRQHVHLLWKSMTSMDSE